MDGHKQSSKIAKALAHPIRLQILEVLDREGESCVCHLEHRLGQRQAYISQQLARLRDAGLVTDRRVGLNVFYDLIDASIGRLLPVIRETAFALARKERQSLVFQPVTGDSSKSCCCPRCLEKINALAG
ncbi:MAG: metalloregulator ArsR/SmtB family transcription factor [Anaerolineales bacterium]|nr:metalloregulator ArsR/SmtB family transcription factor [Anaerolineales bacterium]